MYLGERTRRRKTRSSPVRVVILLILIGLSLYVYALVKREETASSNTLTPTPTRSALSYATEAQELYARGELGLAVVAYNQAIAFDPNNLAYHISVVRLLTLSGETEKAVRKGEELLQVAPENARVLTVLGSAYDWNGNVAKAIETCEHAVEADPIYAEGYACLAEAYIDDGRWLEADETILTALQLDDYSVDVHRNYGYILEIQGNWSAAIEEYNRALEIQPNLAHIHVSIGQNYRALGDIDSAIKYFEQAIEIAPADASANYELGWTYLIYLGEYEIAQPYLKEAVAADPEHGRAYGALAITYWTRRNYEEAIPNFERAIELQTAASRRNVKSFILTTEAESATLNTPSLNVVMRGDFVLAEAPENQVLQTRLAPLNQKPEWLGAQGSVLLEANSGEYTIELTGLPSPPAGESYVGWFDHISTLSGNTLGTGQLRLSNTGNLKATLNTGWVDGPPIEDFYTLGLAYYYLDQCTKAYPLFNAALQIDPEETNAIQGIEFCQESDADS